MRKIYIPDDSGRRKYRNFLDAKPINSILCSFDNGIDRCSPDCAACHIDSRDNMVNCRRGSFEIGKLVEDAIED